MTNKSIDLKEVVETQINNIISENLIVDITTGFHSYLNNNYSTTNYQTKGYTYLIETTLNKTIEGILKEYFLNVNDEVLYEGFQFKIYSKFAEDYIIGIVSGVDLDEDVVIVSIYYNSEVVKVIMGDMSL